MKRILFLIMTLLHPLVLTADDEATISQPNYDSPKVVYDFFLDEPEKMSAALFWIRSLMNPLTESPYDMAPEMMDIKVVIHGTEIVTLVKKNYDKYKDAVERMRYYAALGVEFKVCNLAANDYEYELNDFHEFVELVPSAFIELVHWQQHGYALIIPQVHIRRRSLEEIR
ncbi:MAG: DsrE family protein [Candidatus Thiodiazotropha taylori]|nr:DsrE family protein [Candidatus Thiodiazotropha taylori]MCG8105124.1 DsrE family protein [Candidatus Thiodiazotropha taylori]MCG8109203.1 DsrE family protein [Candidatus Thiodiazotropha taylori]MCG8124091.1 DsrE family protein [Candidatus Thiodiazotropha taylori]MCW4252833.1 DsrE family protein [Candidatus Thiodiazotropha taylori]